MLQSVLRRGDAENVGRLFLVLLVLGGGALLLTDTVSLTAIELPASWEVSLPSLSRNPLNPELSESELVIESGDIEVHFERRGGFESEHMVFGGLNAEPRNTLMNASLSLLEMGAARTISQQYPDFHRCSSQGASKAKSRIDAVSVIAIDGATRNKLHEVIDVHLKRVRENGDRICLAMSGELLSLSSVQQRESGRDVSAQALSTFRETQFLLARTVEMASCEALLDR